MSALATNTFATVCFKKNAQFDFESLVTEFQQALEGGLSSQTRIRRIGGQFVSFDLGRAQLSLAYSSASVDHDSQRAHQASLAVYVSAGETSGMTMSSGERAGLCKGVLDRIEAVHPCDHRVWGETDRDIRPLYHADDAPLSMIVAAEPTSIAPRRVPQPAKTRRLRPAGLPTGTGLDGEQIGPAKRARVPVHPTHPVRATAVNVATIQAVRKQRGLPRQVALGLPQTDLRDQSILRNVFLPDPDAADTATTVQPVAHRLAIYTLNTTLVVICLPVGAAMFSYCAMGRENLNAVGRAMALTGVGIALAQSALADTLLPLFG